MKLSFDLPPALEKALGSIAEVVVIGTKLVAAVDQASGDIAGAGGVAKAIASSIGLDLGGDAESKGAGAPTAPAKPKRAKRLPEHVDLGEHVPWNRARTDKPKSKPKAKGAPKKKNRAVSAGSGARGSSSKGKQPSPTSTKRGASR